MSHPHDRLIRYLASRRVYAAALARLVLPPVITEMIDFDGLRVEPGRQLDPELRERIVDLLFHLPFVDGGGAWLDVIFEHQSESDRWMPMRIYHATAQRWSQWHRDNPGGEALPMVFTVVLSHDPGGWRAATDVAQLLALTPEQRRRCEGWVPSTPYHVFDLAAMDDAALRVGADAAAVELTLLCFKYARDVESLREMIVFRAGLITATSRASDGKAMIMALLRYLAQVVRGDDAAQGIYATIVQAVEPAVAEEIEMDHFEEFVEAFGRNWRKAFEERLRAKYTEEGIERGMAHGIERGIERGRRATLANQLRARFELDTLPPWLNRRLEAADADALSAAERRIFTAETPADVFPD